MDCCYCKHWVNNGWKSHCGLISLAPRPYFRVIPGGCWPWDCAYNKGELKSECPKCSGCAMPDYPNGKVKEGCPACSEVDKYKSIKGGDFCKCGVRVEKGVEYPRHWHVKTQADDCEMAEQAEGAFEKALDTNVGWYLIGYNKYLSQFFTNGHQFTKEGEYKQNSPRITLREFIKTLNHGVLEKIKKERGEKCLYQITKGLKNFGVCVNTRTLDFRKDNFWEWEKEDGVIEL